MKTGNKT